MDRRQRVLPDRPGHRRRVRRGAGRNGSSTSPIPSTAASSTATVPWPILQGRFILAMLFEYAATLGLIDVAYIAPQGPRNDYTRHWGTDEYECLSRYDGLHSIRLSTSGRGSSASLGCRDRGGGHSQDMAGVAEPRGRVVRAQSRPRGRPVPGSRRGADVGSRLAAQPR